jgi:hypothetical protein
MVHLAWFLLRITPNIQDKTTPAALVVTVMIQAIDHPLDVIE